MAEPFLISSYFLEYILPFVLVFSLIFAILQKTKLLGDESRRVNVIISIVVGILLIATPYPRDIIVKLMPFLAVFAVILLVFMLLWGFISGKTDGDVLSKGLKITFGIILGIAMIIVLLMISGFWDVLANMLTNGSEANKIIINGVLIVVVIAAVAAVLFGEGNKK